MNILSRSLFFKQKTVLLVDFQNLILCGKTNKHKKEGLKLWFLRLTYEKQGADAEKKIMYRLVMYLVKTFQYWIRLLVIAFLQIFWSSSLSEATASPQ